MSRPANPGPAPKPILVPVDFGTAARAALVTGARLAMATGAPLQILHVVHVPADRPNYYRRDAQDGAMLPLEELARRMLESFLRDVHLGNPDLRILGRPNTLLVSGLPATRIPEVAGLIDAGLIVIGQDRAKGLLGNLFALPSERIANRCDIPVTVVFADEITDGVELPGREPPPTPDGNAALGA